MSPKLNAALVIARRDYVATVFSKAFLFFLIGPLLPVLFALAFTLPGNDSHEVATPTIAVVATDMQAKPVTASYLRLSTALRDAVPALMTVGADRNGPHQIAGLLRRPDIAIVVSGLPDKPIVTGSAEALDRYGPIASLIIDDAHRTERLDAAHIAPPPVKIARHIISRPVISDATDGRRSTAHGAQLILFMLTMILAGMLLSNLIEEKSNKVIEILTAAAPVDAIFFGKLAAMLGMALTGASVWAAAGIMGLSIFAPHVLTSITAPAIGWPAMIALGILYFAANYLLIGALFLGIGAQASSVREVQTLSFPVTMIQVGVFGLASSAADHLGNVVGLSAMIFPWSSPIAMVARGAELPALWPHLIALAWQALWVALIVRMGARMFRRSVLKSGGPREGVIKAIRRALRK